MTTEEELPFRVPDISIYPKFSIDRHKPQSRLHNFHSLDYEEEMFIDISYCDKSFNRAFNSNSLMVTLNDFNVLLSNRKGSTSTPFKEDFASFQLSKKLPKTQLGSVTEDSGFNESSVASTFANSCVINSPVQQRSNKRPRETSGWHSLLEINSELSNEPFPCLSLQTRFQNLHSDSDSSNDSADVPLSTKPVSFQKNISDCSSGYVSFDSQIESESKTDNSSTEDYSVQVSQDEDKVNLLEQVVPEINLNPSFINEICDLETNAPTKGCVVRIQPEAKESVPASSNNILHRVQEALKKVSPKDPQRVIGRKIGLQTVDIISELKTRNVLPALSELFRYIDGTDLCSMCCVSTAWNESVSADKSANDRRLSHLQNSHVLQSEKENNGKKNLKASRGLTGRKTDKPLCSLQHAAARTTDCRSKAKSKYDQFIQAASQLKNGESLRKCPKCMGPSRVCNEQERAVCVNEYCLYDFCIKCRNVFHGSSECVFAVCKKSRHESGVGSKKSKKALKRL